MSPRYFKNDQKLYGTAQALRRLWHRRRALIGYIVLVIAVGYSFNAERVHSNANHEKIVTSAKKVVSQSCNDNQELRTVIRTLIQDSNAQVAAQLRAHKITPAEAKAEYAIITKDVAKVHPLNCNFEVSEIK